MAAQPGNKETAINLVNQVQERLGLNPTDSLDSNDHTKVLTALLNEVIVDLNDTGRWEENYFEVKLTALSSVRQYVLRPKQAVSGGEIGGPAGRAVTAKQIHDVFEVAISGIVSPLWQRSKEDMRRLRRVRSFGVPRQWSLMGTTPVTAHPIIEVFPVPSSAQNLNLFNIGCYFTEPIIDTSATATVFSYPSNVIRQGLYVEALEESLDGMANNVTQHERAKYERLKKNALSRRTSDTGGDELRIFPGDSGGGNPWRSR